jgi:hypothetical protein
VNFSAFRNKVFNLIIKKLKESICSILIFVDIDFKKKWIHIEPVKGWLSKQESYILFLLAKIVNNNIIEIGSYEGKSTLSMALGTNWKVFAIDPHSGDKSEVEKHLKVDTFDRFLNNTKHLRNIVPIKLKSSEAATLFNQGLASLLFIDGWHSEEEVTKDITNWKPHMRENYVVIFDDWQDSEVGNAIKNSIDLIPPFLGTIGKLAIFSNLDLVRLDLLGLLFNQKVDFKK